MSAGEAAAAARALVGPLAARAEEADRACELPAGDLEDLRAAGLIRLMVPERLGGSGATFAEYAAVATALGEGSGATALVFNMHASVTGALARTPDHLARALGAPDFWFDARDRALLEAASGALFAVAMSERAAGSRLSSLTTSYRAVPGGFRLTGSKAWVSGAAHADRFLVAARDEASETPRVSYFLVPAGDGVVVERAWDALGMRGTGSHDLHLDVELPADSLVGGVEGAALLLARVMPQWLVASYAAVYVGVARSALVAGSAHVLARSTADIPAVRARLGRGDALVSAAGLAASEAARRVDDAPGASETNRWVYRAKLLAGDVAAEVSSSALEAAGSAATRRGHPLERIFRDARCGSLQPATSDVCADWLGLAVLGRDPDAAAERPRW